MSIKARFEIIRSAFQLSVDVAIPGSGVTALLGPSGCGKTSLLRAIAGLDRHPKGRLSINGTVWQDAGSFVAPHLRRLGFVFQQASLFPHLTVQNNLNYGARRRRKKTGYQAHDVIDLLGIGHLLKRRPSTLSGGEQQRVAIARALHAQPDLLLLDEPLAALDRERKQDVIPYLETLHQSLSIPVVYVSHSLDEVARLADHVVLFDGNHIQSCQSVERVFTHLELPLAAHDDAESIIEGTIRRFDQIDGLTEIEFANSCSFWVVGDRGHPGAKVRLRIAARDVSLTLKRPEATSILNCFEAKVDAIDAQHGKPQVTVRLLVGDRPILSRITRKSSKALDLVPGMSLYVQVKTAAVA